MSLIANPILPLPLPERTVPDSFTGELRTIVTNISVLLKHASMVKLVLWGRAETSQKQRQKVSLDSKTILWWQEWSFWRQKDCGIKSPWGDTEFKNTSLTREPGFFFTVWTTEADHNRNFLHEVTTAGSPWQESYSSRSHVSLKIALIYTCRSVIYFQCLISFFTGSQFWWCIIWLLKNPEAIRKLDSFWRWTLPIEDV